jgi:threonine dehydrogenase-like Zn-dependent dehydrogenase
MTTRATAAVLEKPRDLQLREFPIPQIGLEDGILRVEACGLCGTDYEQWQGHLHDWGGGLPIIPGHEVIGFIEAVGANAAKRWKVKEGDRVAVEPVIPCGHCPQCASGAYTRCEADSGYGLYHGTQVAPSLWGGYSTHLYLHPRAMLHHLPPHVPPDVMTLFNPLSNAVRWIYEVGKVGLGATVVITGPGQRGLLAAFVAKQAGTASVIVTGTSKDAQRLELARQFGACATINVDKDDPVARVRTLTNGKLADIVLDVSAGATAPVVQAVDMVRRGGRIVLAGLKGRNPLKDFLVDKVVFREIELVGVLSAGWTACETAIDLVSRHGKELAPLCSHVFPLSQAAEAVRALGRETAGERDAVHVTLQVAGERRAGGH